jgi:hypothetical protein
MSQTTELRPAPSPGLRDARLRPLLELCVGYGLILATCWTPRPLQGWLWWASVLFIVITTGWSFPGRLALGFRRGGFLQSAWVVVAAATVLTSAIVIAIDARTYHAPHGIARWVLTFGGYVVWSFVQQFLLQGYFLYRFLKLVPRREYAALAAAGIFAAAHLPNPVLTPLTLVWGLVACFVFLQYRNIYPLMLAHAMLGIMISICVPGPVVRNMRVGLGYLHYHRPAIYTIPAPLSPPAATLPRPPVSPDATAKHSAV